MLVKPSIIKFFFKYKYHLGVSITQLRVPSNGRFISILRPFFRHGGFNPFLIIVDYQTFVPFFKFEPTNLCPRNYVPTNMLNFINPRKLGPTKTNDFTASEKKRNQNKKYIKKNLNNIVF